MMKRGWFCLAVVLGVLMMAFPAFAHFQLIIPSKLFIEGSPQKVKLFMPFTHPMEGGPTMEMAKPIQFGVMVGGKKLDLTDKLKPIKLDVFPRWNPNYKEYKGKKATAYVAEYLVKMPGDYQFFIVPKPYFEPAEEKFIWQIAKVVVSAFGAEEGWDQPVGLKAEIIPLVKPYAIWAGNVFRGKVLIDGKPAAGIEVEVEYYNQDGAIGDLPSDAFITQVVKTDENGVFSYAIPWPGWWGFSALGDGGKMEYKGKEYPVELDAVIWVKAFALPKGAER